MRYQVVDIQTGQVIGTYASSRSAYRVADRRDAAYGAVRYIVRFI